MRAATLTSDLDLHVGPELVQGDPQHRQVSLGLGHCARVSVGWCFACVGEAYVVAKRALDRNDATEERRGRRGRAWRVADHSKTGLFLTGAKVL